MDTEVRPRGAERLFLLVFMQPSDQSLISADAEKWFDKGIVLGKLTA
ncbi:MAG: hypothetical protein K6G15_11245 [Desulfovibrio sp.]|nr:hypothetical protein [Desulfovibrio sp.]